MSKLSKDILAQIKQQKMTPKSRWYFVTLHTAIWAAVIITLILGSLGIAVALRHLSLTDWELARQASPNPLSFLPILWITIIIIAIVVADKIFKKTKKGYKFKLSHIIATSIVLSLVLGSGFYFVEADQSFENSIRENFEPYQRWENKRAAKFVMPHMGVLAGEIIAIDENEEWMVVDFNGKQWKVDTSEADIAPNLNQSVGSKVGMKGELHEEIFEAQHIRSFQDSRERLKNRRKPPRLSKPTSPLRRIRK